MLKPVGYHVIIHPFSDSLMRDTTHCQVTALPRRRSVDQSASIMTEIVQFMTMHEMIEAALPALWTGLSVSPRSNQAETFYT